jgi:hypothetical protein
MTSTDADVTMGTNFKTGRNDEENEKHKSPNPQDKKKARTKAEAERTNETENELSENEEDESSVKNLGGMFDKASEKPKEKTKDNNNKKAETEKTEKKKYAGGKQIWNNLICGAKNTYELTGRKMYVHAYKTPEIFDDTGEYVHDLAMKGKNLKKKGTHLTALEWKNLFKEVCESETALTLSEDGKKLRIFGIRLAKSNPKELFEDFMWDGYALSTKTSRRTLLKRRQVLL